MTDTIFALASGAGRAGIAVYRLSGPGCDAVFKQLCGEVLPAPRLAKRVRLCWENEIIDDGVALRFKAPVSFTGEDVIEFHLHGGMAVSSALADSLLAMGVRPAEPGEFSRRAFAAGKIDLTQAEGIADLVDAETAEQRRQALRQMDGALFTLYDQWREKLLSSLAFVEAEIDFSDEDLPGELVDIAKVNLVELADAMQEHLDDGRRGEKLREGYWLSLLGPVNAGKSSLLNMLAGRAAAIVSHHEGTTRDIIEVRLDIAGIPVTLADTAGLRKTAEEVEEEGIRRARERASQSDLRLVIIDGTKLPSIDPEIENLLKEGRSLAIVNKIDQISVSIPNQICGCPTLAISAKTGQGMDDLLKALIQEIGENKSAATPPLTRARHRAAIIEAETSIRRSLTASLPELAAEDIRVAARALGRITGSIDVEDVLDTIFSKFCIGK